MNNHSVNESLLFYGMIDLIDLGKFTQEKLMEHAKLYERLADRLSKLEKFPRLKEDKSITALMEENGISRRDFMKWAAGLKTGKERQGKRK